MPDWRQYRDTPYREHILTNLTTADLTTADLDFVADEHLASVLLAMAGPGATPHQDQDTAVRALVRGERVLVVQRTGWGKSGVYWAATSALRSMGRGPTLVISPLLSLMRDQVSAAAKTGLSARTINSGNIDEWDETMNLVLAGEIDVLLVSPERLSNPKFASRMAPVLAALGMLVIDEAHCISDWGFDFRPDYQRLAKVLTKAGDIPVLATTATANARVTADVAMQMGDETVVLRGGLARTTLHLSVVPGLGPLERYAWVDEALSTLEGSGIIYVPTVAETTRLSGWLEHRGHNVVAYSGQTSVGERERIEDKLRANELKAVVATSALGMGYDKPDLGFTIHVGSPDSPVAYYQQVGRAGRAISKAEAVLLPAETDERLWEYFATSSIPNPGAIGKVLSFLDSNEEAVSIPKIVEATGVRKGRVEALLKIVAVEGAVERTENGWISTGVGYTFDEKKWNEIVAARADEASLMRSYARGEGCLMEFLQRALDDNDPGPCGTCSVCTGVLPRPGATPSPAVVEAARVFLQGVDVVLEPRKLWPSGTVSGKKGQIGGIAEGRALTYADTPGWDYVSQIFEGPDGDLPDAVIQGVISVLTRWKSVWGVRPVAVSWVPSRRHPRMIKGLAEAIGAVGKLPVIDVLEVSGPRPGAGAVSRDKVDSLTQGLSLRKGVKVPYGPVLLVDDTYRSGWTMTVAGDLLRQGGASAIYPLVVQQLP
jgi:ATP-dependent DNA helicase RecQ